MKRLVKIDFIEFYQEPSQMATEHARVSTIATKMLSDLNRFQFICNPEAQNFDPLYVNSTFLNLPYRGILESSQVLEAKMFFTCEMKHASNYDDDEHDGNNDHNDQSMPVMETESPKKRLKHLSRVSIILEEKESNEDSRAGVNLTAEDLEIENYSKYKDDLCSEPFSF